MCLMFLVCKVSYGSEPTTVSFFVLFLIDDRLYNAILRSLEQTHCARMWFYMSV